MRLTKRRASLAVVALASLLLTLATIAAIAAAAQLKERENRGGVIHVYSSADELWKVVESNHKVLVFVEQEFCAGCRELRPYVEELAASRSDLVVVALHIDSLAESDPVGTRNLLARLGIWGTPTLLLFRDGELVARHDGLFPGDQLIGLEQFVALAGEGLEAWQPQSPVGSLERVLGGGPAGGLVGVAAGLGFGVAAAFSPCSLPLLAAYAATGASMGKPLGGKRLELLRTSLTVLGAVGLGGIAVAYVTTLGLRILAVPVTAAVGLFAGYFTILWGLYEARGYELSSRALARASSLVPLLGLQCSLPFLLAALALASASLPSAAASALAFVVGFSAPYIAAGTAASHLLRPLANMLGRSGPVRGVLLLGVGAYLLYYSITQVV
jgi:thiol-disulfide isomerase/thioredoxin/cytochrome c biogenesis protein CcdA